MKKHVPLSLLLLCISIASGTKCSAQFTLPDSSLQASALSNAVQLYHASIGNQSPLYTGPEYYYYDRSVKGDAYFNDVNAFTKGSIYYDGALYNGVSMLYDVYYDKVVVLHFNHFSKFSLLKERVKSFDISSHHFVNVIVDSTAAKKPEIKSGFYDEIYNGKTEVLVKRAKNIQTSLASVVGLESYFSPTSAYFIKKENTFYRISGEGSVLDVFKDRKKQLQQYIKANKIKFRKNPEEAMVKIASYYDQLTN